MDPNKLFSKIFWFVIKMIFRILFFIIIFWFVKSVQLAWRRIKTGFLVSLYKQMSMENKKEVVKK